MHSHAGVEAELGADLLGRLVPDAKELLCKPVFDEDVASERFSHNIRDHGK